MVLVPTEDFEVKDYSDISFWLATYGPYEPNPPLQGDLVVDVAIIGGGFTGLSTSSSLCKNYPGQIVAVLESQSDLTSVWLVNRRMIPWPPEPLRLIASHAIRGYMRIEDAFYERKMPV